MELQYASRGYLAILEFRWTTSNSKLLIRNHSFETTQPGSKMNGVLGMELKYSLIADSSPATLSFNVGGRLATIWRSIAMNTT